MNTLDIKTNFHHLIDQINDEQLLIKLYHIMEQARFYNRWTIMEQIDRRATK